MDLRSSFVGMLGIFVYSALDTPNGFESTINKGLDRHRSKGWRAESPKALLVVIKEFRFLGSFLGLSRPCCLKSSPGYGPGTQNRFSGGPDATEGGFVFLPIFKT